MTRTCGFRSILSLVFLAVSVFAAVISGCAASRQVLPTAEEMVASGAAPAGSDAEAMRRGRATYITECAGCHRLYTPSEYTPNAWRPIARRMGRRIALGEDEIADLLAYLTAASRAGK
jgi:mono/diheme cytochrome c family protein